MEPIKSLKNIKSKKLAPDQKLTAAELGKLWATYVGNTMSKCILTSFLNHVDDEEIKQLLNNGKNLAQDFIEKIEGIMKKDHVAIPKGFTDEDVNLQSPRLYKDEFYVHYLKYAAKAGLSLYAVAIPLVLREDVRNFFAYCNKATIELLSQINDMLMSKDLIIKIPEIPIPKEVDFVHKQNFFSGFLGEKRPLHALEIIHLYDNIENNVTSKALITGFSQVANREKVRDFFIRGKEITDKAIRQFKEKLEDDNLPSPSYLDHLVTSSSIAPFSDRLMTFHKVDMFSMKIRSFSNSIAVNGRRDIALVYSKAIANVLLFVDDGGNLLIENGWMEQPPTNLSR
ncbi:hypothetical protein JOC77_004157 [Peribacillus deserti]|uniref:DUF3231 domain-containing protein n=1 Tax=Peribacillus deserti TaxID=673318 RepID=A0ABS2QNT0_9BACI|nr:DUF3231 family protein [Peribacillus deserti]MBM7694680.1 hypothetical protein [Peribacillus deserti]